MLGYTNMHAIVKVRKGTPLDCTEEHFKSSRISISKTPYSFERHIACEEHEIYEWADDDCNECKVEIVSYSTEHLLNSAIKTAKDKCTIYEDAWVVDGDTLKIIAAFRMNIEQIK